MHLCQRTCHLCLFPHTSSACPLSTSCASMTPPPFSVYLSSVCAVSRRRSRITPQKDEQKRKTYHFSKHTRTPLPLRQVHPLRGMRSVFEKSERRWQTARGRWAVVCPEKHEREHLGRPGHFSLHCLAVTCICAGCTRAEVVPTPSLSPISRWPSQPTVGVSHPRDNALQLCGTRSRWIFIFLCVFHTTA